MRLNELKDNAGARKNRNRVGRGIGSGSGKTSQKGHKGQKARSGVAIDGFGGGQTSIYRRLPKRGFNNPFPKDYDIVNLGRLQSAIDNEKLDSKKPVDVVALRAAGLVGKAKDGWRLLAKGELKAKLEIHADGISVKAKEAVEAVGGTVTIIEPKVPAHKAAAAAKKAESSK